MRGLGITLVCAGKQACVSVKGWAVITSTPIQDIWGNDNMNNLQQPAGAQTRDFLGT